MPKRTAGSPRLPPPPGAPDARRAPTHLARQRAGADLEQAARRFVVISEQVLTGDATEQQGHVARFELERAALRYAAAFGWGPPA